MGASRRIGALGLLLVLATFSVAAIQATTPTTSSGNSSDGGIEATPRTVAHRGTVPAEPTVKVRAESPNIVMVMTDDMRYDDLRFAPYVSHLMKKQGIEFRNSFSNYPLCCPARASFFTGQYAHNHGVYSHVEPYGFGSFDDRRTIGGALQKAGYRTGFVGKYLNGYGSDNSKVTGQSSYNYVPDGWTDWYGAVERPTEDKPVGGTYDYYRTNYNINGVSQGTKFHGQYQTNTMGRFGRDLVAQYSKTKDPFFLYLAFVAPHHGEPREADDPQKVLRSDGTLQDFPTPARPEWVKGRFDNVKHAPGIPTGAPTEANTQDKPRYLKKRPELTQAERDGVAEVTRQRAEAIYVVDRQVKRLVEKLKATGEWDDTVLVFTSDNGYFLGEHRIRDGKTTAQEPSLRVPFLIAGKDIPRGEVRHDPITTVDITATLLDLAGASAYAPHTPDGLSKVPSIVQGDRGWDRPVLDEAILGFVPVRAKGFDDPRRSIGVRTARWSFIRYASGAGELYDLLEDPNQLSNLYRDPAHRDVRKALTQVWWDIKDCDGTACRPLLPAELRAAPDVEARLSDAWYDGVATWQNRGSRASR